MIENPRSGGLPGGVGGEGAGRVSAGDFWGGGGAKYFFRGRNSHQVWVMSCKPYIRAIIALGDKRAVS